MDVMYQTREDSVSSLDIQTPRRGLKTSMNGNMIVVSCVRCFFFCYSEMRI